MEGQSTDDTTWEYDLVLKSQFPHFRLEDKAEFSEGSYRTLEPNYDNKQDWDQMLDLTPKKPLTWKVYSRRKRELVSEVAYRYCFCKRN